MSRITEKNTMLCQHWLKIWSWETSLNLNFYNDNQNSLDVIIKHITFFFLQCNRLRRDFSVSTRVLLSRQRCRAPEESRCRRGETISRFFPRTSPICDSQIEKMHLRRPRDLLCTLLVFAAQQCTYVHRSEMGALAYSSRRFIVCTWNGTGSVGTI